MSFVDRVARIFFGGGAPTSDADMPPLFRAIWRELDRAVGKSQFRIHKRVRAFPNVAQIFVTDEDHRQHIEPWSHLVDQAIAEEVRDLRARHGFPDGGELVVRIEVADPAQLPEVGPGRPFVQASSVADPHAVENRWKSVLKRTTVVGARGTRVRVAAAPAVAATPGQPLVVLKWRDARGERTASLYEPGTFGRRAPDSVEDVQLDAGPEEDEDNDLSAVSRRALGFERAPSGRIRVINHGKVDLKLEGAGLPKTLPARGGEEIGDAAALVWPGFRAADGFRLELRAPSDGEVELSDGELRQVVPLRAPRTRVCADAKIFGAVGIDFQVDLTVAHTGALMIRNLGVPLRYGPSDEVERELIWRIEAARPLHAGRVRVEIRYGAFLAREARGPSAGSGGARA